MSELKSWIPELLLDTIVATACAVVARLTGLDATWGEASVTFATCFVVMFALGVLSRIRRKRQQDQQG